MTTAPWTITAAALCVLAALTPLQKGGKDKDKKGGERDKRPAATAPAKLTPWLGKLDEARASAKERNVPILVHVVLEGEQSNDEYRDKLLPNQELLDASAPLVVIVANNGTHERKKVEEVVGDEKVVREVCAAYPAFETCAQHQATWDDLYREFHDDKGDLRCPQTIVLLPDGKASGTICTGNVPEVSEVLAMIDEARRKAGPGLSQAQLDLVVKSTEEARGLMTDKRWASAWKAWQSVLAVTTTSVHAQEAQREQPKALAGMQAEVERIAAALAPGTAAKAYAELVKYGAELAGTPLEKDVQTRLKRAENDKAIAAEIKAWKLSLEADGLLREARELQDAGETKKAERVVRKLLGKKYAGTPAQEVARTLWPEVAGDG